ncbi:MAG: hypothetical protein JWO07_795 [Candidatus Saccharibacteria bacterium]|nr:hypothetical protein [Candidatus Saccharibacteria bacterium]
MMRHMRGESGERIRIINQHGTFGSIAFVTWIGAFVYFIHDAKNFGDFLFGFLEAWVWPGILLYHVLKAVGA